MAEQIALNSISTALSVDTRVEADTNSKADLEESRWIDRAVQGELAAFDWLISRYRERALRLAAHVLRRPNEAEDVVQEAFLRAFAQIRSFRSDCAFYTWFYRIVVRLCLNRMRSPEWRMRSQTDPELATLDRFQPQSPGPSETRTVVEALLDRLSPPLRATLVLREIAGLEYEEIAEALSIPVGTVRSRLSAAREQFRILWLQIQEETKNV